MPLYDFQCSAGHTAEKLVRYEQADDARVCHCGLPLKRLMHTPHTIPDGVYSYSPNVGSPETFERRYEAIRNGKKTIDGEQKSKEPGI
jgi:putative FmdB family regulatory protein